MKITEALNWQSHADLAAKHLCYSSWFNRSSSIWYIMILPSCSVNLDRCSIFSHQCCYCVAWIPAHVQKHNCRPNLIVSTIASQQEGCGFDSWVAQVPAWLMQSGWLAFCLLYRIYVAPIDRWSVLTGLNLLLRPFWKDHRFWDKFTFSVYLHFVQFIFVFHTDEPPVN